MRLTFLIYDNDSTVNDFPLGIGYLISMLRKNGYGYNDKDIDVYNMDVYHYSDKHLLNYLETNEFDIVCIGMIAGYWQYRQLKRMFQSIDQLKKRPKIILGGFMFTPEPAYFMKKFKADYVVMGEGELPFPKLVENIANNRSVKELPGIAYWLGDKVVLNPRQEPIKVLDTIPYPAWDKFPVNAYVPKVRIPIKGGQRSMPVLSGRGCLYKCVFCYRMEKGIRYRSWDNVIEEIKKLVKDYHLNAICFRDELLMSTPKRAQGLAEAILKAGLKIHFDIDGRLNAVRPDVLELLKKAGCVYINYGVESLDQNVLNNMKKAQKVEHIISGVEKTIKAGIIPGLNVIFGHRGDSRETAMKTVQFLKKYNTHGEFRTLKPVTPYPGSPLYYEAIDRGLLRDCEDFYENKHLNSDMVACNFTDMSNKELSQVLFDTNEILIKDYYNHHCEKTIKDHKTLYFDGDVNFRGVRH